MLIELSHHLDQLLSSKNSLTASEISAIENLATASREGKHLITGNRSTLDLFSKRKELSSRAKGTFQHINARVAEYGTLVNELQFHTSVVPSHPATNLALANDQKVLYIPLLEFSDSKAIQATVLLAESHYDAAFYKEVTKLISNMVGFGRLRFDFELSHGGGASIADIYELAQQQNRFCIAIADSDRIAPYSHVGTTATKLSSSNRANHLFTDYLILECHSIENLMPIGFLKEVDVEDTPIRHIHRFHDDNDLEISRFISLKINQYLGSVIQWAEDEAFWKERAKYLASLCQSQLAEQCLETGECLHPKSCKCCWFKNVGGGIPKKVANLLKTAEEVGPLTQHLDRDGELFSIGIKLLAWSVSLGPYSV